MGEVLTQKETERSQTFLETVSKIRQIKVEPQRIKTFGDLFLTI
jgi:hypothetical protein